MGDTNSKEQIQKEINNNELKDDTSILRKPSILKKPKNQLVSLKSTPNLLNLRAQGYLKSLKYKKQFKKESSKKVSINIDNNEYYFMDNSKNPKKNNCKSTSELTSFAKEKFLDDLLFLNDVDNENNEFSTNNEKKEKKENDEKKENIENNNNVIKKNGNNNFNKEESEKSSSDYDSNSNEDNKNGKSDNEKEKNEINEKKENIEYKLIYENENFDNKNGKNEQNNNNENKENKVENTIFNIENSFFLFDWDDTINCTSKLLKYKKKLSKDEKIQIKNCENIIHELFTKILEKGKIFIITDLDVIHIETSIIKYYPSLHSKLNKLEIISTKEKSKSKNYKIYSFVQNQRDEDNDIIKNIICFVDSSIQNSVSDILKSNFNNAFIKIIKFNQNPNLNDLIKQFSLVNQNFNNVYNNEKSFIIKIEKN